MLTILLTFQKHQKKNTQDNTRVTHLSPANLQELLLWYKVAVMQSNWSPHRWACFSLKNHLVWGLGRGRNGSSRSEQSGSAAPDKTNTWETLTQHSSLQCGTYYYYLGSFQNCYSTGWGSDHTRASWRPLQLPRQGWEAPTLQTLQCSLRILLALKNLDLASYRTKWSGSKARAGPISPHCCCYYVGWMVWKNHLLASK